MSTVDIKKIWEVYEIPEDQGLRHNARQTIRRYWCEYLKKIGKPKDFPWERLTELEQDKFIYREIKDFMKNLYVNQAWKDIENKINRYIHNSPLAVEDRIQTSIDSKMNLFRDHRTTTHSDAKKQEAYKALCSDIQAYNANVPLPTYEEFEKELSLNAAVCPEEADYETRVQYKEVGYRNIRVLLESQAYGVARDDEEARAEDRAKAEAEVRAEDERKAKGKPIRAYDYVMTYEDTMNNRWLPVDGDERIYLRIILQVLEEKLGLKVDYDMVIQCLLCRAKFSEYCRYKGYERNDDWDFPMEYDEKLGMTRDEYEELKERYAEYLSCQKKLNDLKPLYKYEKKD